MWFVSAFHALIVFVLVNRAITYSEPFQTSKMKFIVKKVTSKETPRCLDVSEAATGGCSVKKVFLEISENPQETPVQSLFFNKVAGLRPATLLKENSGAGVFL